MSPIQLNVVSIATPPLFLLSRFCVRGLIRFIMKGSRMHGSALKETKCIACDICLSRVIARKLAVLNFRPSDRCCAAGLIMVI
jgi:hypothetical protein